MNIEGDIEKTQTAPEQLAEMLLRLNPKQQEVLREHIKNSGGTIRMFIHPLFEKYKERNPYYRKSQPRIEIVEKGLLEVLKKSDEETPPIFIFEEQEKLATTEDELQRSFHDKKMVFVPTFKMHGTPILPGQMDYDAEESLKREENYVALRSVLKLLDVREIIIGGMYLYKDGDKLDGCLGSVIKALQGEFKIEISSLAHPSSRKDFR